MPISTAGREAAGLALRPLRPGDEPGLLTLLQEAFGRWPGVDGVPDAPAHLRWKLMSHPLAESLHVVALQNERIIAALLYFVQEVKVGDQRLLARQAVDSCVHPDHQRQGIMTELRRFSWERSAHVVDLQFGPLAHEAIVRLDERENGKLFRAKVDVLVRPSGQMAGAVEPRAASSVWTLRPVTSFDDRLDELAIKASMPFDFILMRTSRYLNWRYFAPGAGQFSAVVAEAGDEVLGYVVARMSGGRGRIVDLLTLPGRSDVLESLIAAAKDDLCAASTVECWLPRGHPYRSSLEAAGFVARRRTMRLTFGALRASDRVLEILQTTNVRLHFAAGDTDLV